jgi:hypothetical protein
MPLLVMQVALSGELVEVFEIPVDGLEGHQMLAKANEDERSITRHGQDVEDGELWWRVFIGRMPPMRFSFISAWRPMLSETASQNRTSPRCTRGIGWPHKRTSERSIGWSAARYQAPGKAIGGDSVKQA